ncbi:unnamed protein product, partial [Prorocentrum cordatum]
VCAACGAPSAVCWAAAVFYRRFFAARSPAEFDPLLVLLACVHLACKVEEVHEVTLDRVLEAAGLGEGEGARVSGAELPLLEAVGFQLFLEPKPDDTALRMLAEDVRRAVPEDTLTDAGWCEAIRGDGDRKGAGLAEARGANDKPSRPLITQTRFCLCSRTTMQHGIVDSQAVFQQRLEELGLGDLFQRFVDLGWASYGNFAFAMSSGPGGIVEDVRFGTTIVMPLFQIGPEEKQPPRTAAVRRLFFESHALSVSELRHRTERTDQDAPRKVPQAEREARKEVLRKRLAPGLQMEGELDPSNVLVDRFVQMVEENTLQWVPWEMASKRDQELTTQPGRKKWFPDGTGTVRERNVSDPIVADVSNALKVSWALQRRGLAMEVARLMTFEGHELLRNKLLAALTREVPDDRYEPPTLDNLRSADKEVWKKLSRLCAGGVRPATARDQLPTDSHIQTVFDSVEVNMLLMPLAKAGASSSKRKAEAAWQNDDNVHKRRKGGKGGAFAPPPQPAAEPRKGKDRGKKWTPAMPKELLALGGVPLLPDRTPICYGYNSGRCREQVRDGRCARGMHVCCRKGCGGKHPISERTMPM